MRSATSDDDDDTTRSDGRSPTEVATASKSPPSLSVALVMTTVLSVSSLSRMVPQHLQRRHAQLVATALPVALGHPEHVGVGVGGHPLGGLEQLLRPALGLGRDRVVAEVLGERRDQRPRRVAHQHEGVGELLRDRVDPARRRRVDRVAQRVTGVGQVVGLGSVDVT